MKLIFLLFSYSIFSQVLLPEIYIIGAREKELIQNYIPSTSLISKNQLDHNANQNIVESLQKIPGLQITQSGNKFSESQIYLRGTDNKHTLVLIDGVDVSDASIIGKSVNLSYLNTEDIEKIEIIKGSQAMRFGSNALGGVVSIITKSGDYKTKSNFELGLDSFNSYRFSGSLQTRGKLGGLRLSAFHENFGGFDLSSQNGEHDGGKNSQISFKYDTSLSSYVKFEMGGKLQVSKNDNDEYIAGVGIKDDVNDTSSQWQQNIWLSPTYEKKQTKIWGLYSFTRNLRHYDNLSDGGTIKEEEGEYQGKSHQVDLSWQEKWKNFKTTLTYRFDFDEASSHYFTPNFSSSFPLTSLTNHSFAMILKKDFAKFSYELGLNHHINSLFNYYMTYQAGISYRFSAKHTLSLDMGKGYHLPGLYEFFDSQYGNQNLIPESNLSFELKNKIEVKQVTYDASLFVNSLKNLITFVNNKYQNQKENQILGLEQNIAYSHKLFQINANLTAMHFSESSILKKSSLLASLQMSYGKRWKPSLNLSYRGKYNDLDFAGNIISRDPFGLVHLGLEYAWNKNMSVQFFVRNVLDYDYQEVWGYQSPRRNVVLNLKGRF